VLQLQQIDLNAQAQRLEKQIDQLQEDSTKQLKSRLKEVDRQHKVITSP